LRVEAEPVAPLIVKGKAQPLPAWRLLRVRPGAELFQRRLDSPMVGRRRERAELAQAY
jgi:hypothetical protein